MIVVKNTKKTIRRSGGALPARSRSVTLDVGRERFRFTLRREQRRLPALNIDPYVQTCNWARDSAVRTGELNFYRPLTGLQARAIAQGDRVRCEVDVNATGNWNVLWHMTVDTPNHQIVSGLISMALQAGLKAAQKGKATFRFKAQTARQITMAIGKRFRITVGPLPVAKHRIARLTRKSASPLDTVVDAWAAERRATGRRFDVDISRGRIDVTELREPTHVLLIRDAIIDASITQTLRRMTSAVVVTSTTKKNGRKRKIRVKVVDQARVKRYGYIVGQLNEPGLHSAAAARRAGKAYLARLAKPVEDVTFTHPGLPFLDRGDALRLTLADADLLEVLCFVKSTTHQVSAGSYTMDVTVGFADPFVDERKQRAKRKRDEAARRRRRAPAEATKARTPANAARRS